MGGQAFSKEIFVDTVFLFVNGLKILMNGRVIIERDIFDGFEGSFLFSFFVKLFSGGDVFFGFGVGGGTVL